MQWHNTVGNCCFCFNKDAMRIAIVAEMEMEWSSARSNARPPAPPVEEASAEPAATATASYCLILYFYVV